VTKEVRLEDVLSEDNLRKAFEAVKRNKGGAGIDGRGIDATQQHLRQHWHQIEAKLRSGSYSPSPVKGIQIPKASGGQRLLGIPTVQDRLIQQAIQQQLSRQVDRSFSEHSYGFRPNRSAHNAVKAAQQYVQEGKSWVIDIDLKAFFDNVNHDKLIYLVREQVKDKGLLRLVRKILSAGITIDGMWQATRSGTPQGSPLSPLLANIYLDPLDRELEKRGLSFCRYADDINIYVVSERSAQRVYASIVKWIEKHLKLSVNTDKSGTGRPWERQFLGRRQGGRYGKLRP
jgi:RNA-directed DNA polymerase